MTQEVQIILTIEVDTTKSKEDLTKLAYDMERAYDKEVSDAGGLDFFKITMVDVKEEAEICGNE